MLAVVFPGQGSQSLGMLSSYRDNSIVKDVFAEASEILHEDLWEITQTDSSNLLNQTEYTQPILLTASVALWKLWQDRNENTIKPSLLAGHSLGEYSALVCAKALRFKDGLLAVRERGRCMQRAVPAGLGAMAAILGLEDEQVREVCRQAAVGEIVSAANYNSPGQVVIAGQKTAVERAIILANQQGAKRAILLSVSVPSHCDLMKPAAIEFEKTLNGINIEVPEIPVLHNVDVSEHSSSEEIKNCLLAQLSQPVRWVDTIKKMESRGVDTILECGPGSVLTSLNKRIVSHVVCNNMASGEI